MATRYLVLNGGPARIAVYFHSEKKPGGVELGANESYEADDVYKVIVMGEGKAQFSVEPIQD